MMTGSKSPNFVSLGKHVKTNKVPVLWMKQLLSCNGKWKTILEYNLRLQNILGEIKASDDDISSIHRFVYLRMR